MVRSQYLNFVLGALVTMSCFQAQAQAQNKPFAIAFDLNESIAEYRKREADATPDSVLKWLQDGNQRFVAGNSTHGGYPIDARERIQVSAKGQAPIAVVLSCIDSRTTPEMAFDTSVGDIFTVRVGANVVNDDILGSLEIAAESGARVVVVMGHTNCGGVAAACSGLELGHMTQLLERVKPAIANTNNRMDNNPTLDKMIGERVASNPRYLAEVSHENAMLSTKQILERSQILRDKVARGEILLKTALFDVNTGRVIFDQN
jgi:carbonic anhydrase